jgi:hypothetical protein
MSDREEILDELGRVFARAAVDQFLQDLRSETESQQPDEAQPDDRPE